MEDVAGGGVVLGGGSLQSGSVLPLGRKQTVPSDSVIVFPGGRVAAIDERCGVAVGVTWVGFTVVRGGVVYAHAALPVPVVIVG